MKNKNVIKSMILGSIIGILLGSVGLVTYAMLTYNSSSIKNKLVVGDIYMRYKEGSALNLIGQMPSATYPSSSSGNYFEFQIIGKNTNTTGDIQYNLKLAYGDIPNGKSSSNRIGDQFLLFKLVEVENLGENNEIENIIVNDANYNSVPNSLLYTTTIPKNTTNEITKTYRLYARISEDLVIGNENQDYTIAEWNNLFASIKINADGEYDDGKLTSTKLIQALKTNKLTSNNSITETNNGDVITYLSGCSKYYLDQSAKGCTQDNTIDFNYVWYSGRMWRITSFNETTNTIKLITEQPQTAISFGESTTGKTIFYTDANTKSHMYEWLNDEFYDTLYEPTKFIDTSVLWDVTTTTSVSTKLSNPTVTSNVGLLNSYEYYQSYQKVVLTSKYAFGYLNIGQYWWLLNPYDVNYVWNVYNNGNTSHNSYVSGYSCRPSINLLSTIKFTGNGTEADPYRLVGDVGIGRANDNLNTRQVGEYVKLKNGANEQVFRIVSFEGGTTKLVQLDYVKQNGTYITKNFATANSSGNGTIFGEGKTIDETNNTTWYSYLKNVYINDLKTKYDTGTNSMFTTGEYYLGAYANNPNDTSTNYNYRTSICEISSDLTKNCTKSRSKNLEAGLLRYGEMFAAQHGIGYNNKTLTYNTQTMWLMTRRNSTGVLRVLNEGNAIDLSVTESFAARPSINLSSGVKILSGSGLPNDPYVVGI